jgi:intraflagellar transport protein 88
MEKAEELHRRYEANDWQDNAHSDLQFAVQVCVAHCSHMAGLDQEALNIYNSIVRDSEYHLPGRLRVNIGNIYFQNKQWTDAIKQYRMALDQLPNERQVCEKLCCSTLATSCLRFRQADTTCH